MKTIFDDKNKNKHRFNKIHKLFSLVTLHLLLLLPFVMIYHFFPAQGCFISLSIERALGRSCWIKFDSNLSGTSSLIRERAPRAKEETQTVFTFAFFDHAYNQRRPSATTLIDNFVMRDEGTPLTPNWSFDNILCWTSIKPSISKKSCASFDFWSDAGRLVSSENVATLNWMKFYTNGRLNFAIDSRLRFQVTFKFGLIANSSENVEGIYF